MIGKLFYAIRRFFRSIGDWFRQRRTPPDYVMFEIEGDYPYFLSPPSNPIEKRLRRNRTSLRDITRAFTQIAASEKISGVVLMLRPLSMGAAKIDVLRRAIGELRAAGKHVITYAVGYDRQMMYLASAADVIAAQPGALIDTLGLANQYQFFADTLAQAGLEADVVAITPYKSAGDQFARTDMSAEVREMGNWLLDSAYGQMVEAVATGRGMEPDAARQAIDNTPCTDLEAQEMGLIDAVINAEGLPDLLKGGEGDDPPKMGTWDEAKRALKKIALPKPGKYVAVIEVEGFIMDGSSQSPPVRPPIPLPIVGNATAGDKTVVQAVRAAERDPRTAAVVVWVNSQGGSATASEAMAAALKQLSTKKPVVAAFGSVAASGGYYVATPAQWMVAEANSIVGSIGVIASKIAYAGLLDKLQIGRETLKRGEHADLFTAPTTFTESERARVRAYITRTYDIFLDRVGEGRNMGRDQLEPLAGGRVWTGAQALDNGLIDEIGGIDAAISKARELGDLPADAAAYQVQVSGRQRLLPQKPEEESAAAWVLNALRLLQAFNRARALAISPLLWAGDPRERWY